MLFVPLPFVVAILLILLFITVVRREEKAESNKSFPALILLSAFQSLLSGLRWGYGIEAVMYIAPVFAALVPPLAYAGVARLVRERRLPTRLRIGLHAIPALIIALLMAVSRDAIDLVLVMIFLGYAVAILFLMRAGTDALRLAPFDGATPAYHAILFAALALILSAAVDIFIFLDFAWTQGEYARPDKETMAAIQTLMDTNASIATPISTSTGWPASSAFPRGRFQPRSIGQRLRTSRNMSTSTGSPRPATSWRQPNGP